MKHPFSATIQTFGKTANFFANLCLSEPEKMHTVVFGSSHNLAMHSCETLCNGDTSPVFGLMILFTFRLFIRSA